MLPALGQKGDGIQRGAGTQVKSQGRGKTCASHGLTHRTCAGDYEAMNGQLERIVLIAQGVEYVR